MAKYNSTAVKSKPRTVKNLAGGEAFQQDDVNEFVAIMLTSFVKDQYYRKEDEAVSRLKELIAKIPDKKFVAKAAIYARREFGMRSISHIVAGEVGHSVKNEEWTKDFFQRVVRRADDITEILAYYITNYGDTIPNSMKKGLGAALSMQGAYALSKYAGKGKDVSMIDAVRLTHPKSTESISALLHGTLPAADTWETALSKAGQEASSDEEKLTLKADAWAKLVGERTLGYFALLKNLRNLLEQAPEIVPDACKMLEDESLIRKSLVLPFRYLTAYDELKGVPGSNSVLASLGRAADTAAVYNMPVFEGPTLIALDTSGSMSGRPSQIGAIMAAALNKSNDCDFMTFHEAATYENISRDIDVLTAAKSIKTPGGSTDFKSIFKTIKRAYNRIVILSDMQGWVDYHSPQAVFETYKKTFSCDPSIYSFDLAGHGTTQFDTKKRVYQIAGFSEKIFDVMSRLEQDKNALITAVNEVDL